MDPNKRPDDMVRITTPELAQAFIDEQVEAIRAQIGDKVDVKITDIDMENKKVSLSIRALLNDARAADRDEYDD